jgi:hypothetical protein
MQKALEDLPPDDFPVPDDVVGIPVNLATGEPASPAEKGVILEYFIKGTEPKVDTASGKAGPTAGAAPVALEGTPPAPAVPPDPSLIPPPLAGRSLPAGERRQPGADPPRNRPSLPEGTSR